MNAYGTIPVQPKPSRFLILSIVAGMVLVAILFLVFYKKTIGPRIQMAWNHLVTFFRKDGTAQVAIHPGESEKPLLTANLNPEPSVLLPPLTQPLYPDGGLMGAQVGQVNATGDSIQVAGPGAHVPGIGAQGTTGTTGTTGTAGEEPTLEYDMSHLPEPVYVPKAADNPPDDHIGVAPEKRPAGMPGAVDTLGTMPSVKLTDGKEVFNISNNVYTFNDAAAVCAAVGSELATYDQVKAAYERGADWCNYGWIKGQMAIYPTQKETWDSLQVGPSEFRNACGRPGINGGYFDNPDLRFGVTCYGAKPERKPGDAVIESQVALPKSTEELEFEKKVQKFRDQLDSAVILPFRQGQWTA